MLCAKLTVNDVTMATSLRPESERSLPRTNVTMTENGGTVMLSFTASDTSAMRAALNSYLGFIKIVEDIHDITK